MPKCTFDEAIQYGNYVHFFINQPSDFCVLIRGEKAFKEVKTFCEENFSKKDFFFSLDTYPVDSADLYFRNEEDMNLFMLTVPKEHYIIPKKHTFLSC